MITSGFPYGISETYIESEVAFLKDHFERVIILPIELDPGEPIMRALPEGIEYYNVSQKKQSVARTGTFFSPSIVSTQQHSSGIFT